MSTPAVRVAEVVVDLGRSGPSDGVVRMARPDLVYVEFPGLVVAIERDLAPSTPNGVYLAPEAPLTTWAVGAAARVAPGELSLVDATGSGSRLTWTARTPVFDGFVDAVRTSPEVFGHALQRVLGADVGEGCPVCVLVDDHELWTRPRVLTALHALAVRSTAAPLAAAHLDALIGLGRGLTPETDDLVVGALLAQHALGVSVADVLGDGDLAARVAPATTSLSGTWLGLAGAGRAIEPLQAVLAGAPGSDAWARSVQRLLDVGSSTGRSIAVGAILATVGNARPMAVRACRHTAETRCRR